MTDVTLVSLAVGVSVTCVLIILGLAMKRVVNAYRQHYEQQWQSNLTALFLFIPIRGLLAIWLFFIALVLVISVLLLTSIWSMIVALAIAVVIPWRGYRYLRQQRYEWIHKQLPGMLTLLATTLRSGGTLTQGLRFASSELDPPLQQELSVISRQIRLGRTLDDVFSMFVEHYPSDDSRRIQLAFEHGQSLGGKQAVLLESLAQTLRRKQQLQQRIKSLSAQGRLQGKVMTALPLFLLAVLYLIEKQAIEQLSRHPIGWTLASVMLVMLLAGHWLMQRLLKIDVVF
ncbi:MAG: type II secretion system F family protein [Aliidiomarina sp.]|uniref:type II secretion system F family protein n=1 Tax=Aliidiomarina sp. TaxID=1872439 RepID=UPI0025C6FE29|nr:type II secretion system F family protein [Aliidiomarina sp.]MCH8502076.1 type II secretion system F family protein [Aliidiomarina sp.]